MRKRWLDFRHQMQAAAASELRPAIEALNGENVAQLKCCFQDEWPFDAFAGIEIEDHQVGTRDIVDRRGPWVHLDDPDIDKAKQAREVVDPKAGSCLAIGLAP